ncbi:D-glucuronyl C5-epimerase isoform X2 [Aricia agestis]|uniref:D-glucuronyl C5-epimerase isoform X2 n=1 Tax=Aricia agestis TaxID=91739 RepID=UPI001C209BA9|nr:D-glucuronyl C5-epimerase isoform X2 [Aricia agestis]
MMMVRLNMKLALAALCAVALLLMLYWAHCTDDRHKPSAAAPAAERFVAIECSINGEYSVACRRDADQLYLPFSFIKKYFEVYGKLTTVNGVERFEWSHSYSKVYHPKKTYDPRGTFTTFENYNVEVRDRVKCISGVEGVPVSTQWDPKGFFYPTQIAQFGLAHYSKNITEPEPRVKILEDGDKISQNWIISKDAVMSREFDPELKMKVLSFATTDHASSQVWLKLDIAQDFVLTMDLLLKPNSSMTVVLQNKDKKETVYLHYVFNNQLISALDDHIFYGVGEESAWRRVTRDLIVDMQKGWQLLDRPKRKSPRNKFKISSIILRGSGSLGSAQLATSAHTAHFYAAARWLVRSQRPNGGWPVPARRRVAPHVPDLTPGWHSAMSQGHGISVLARAHYRSGDAAFLRAARRALRVLRLPSGAGGVRAVFMDKHVWYEEYPTTPPLFVLNGFIYTLLGLYDLHAIAGDRDAKHMFDDGMASLKALLPLFDTGSGSFYDLRHFTLGVSPNIARWDYHATHVNQLYLLAGLDPDPILLSTAKRWENYMSGKRAAHN